MKNKRILASLLLVLLLSISLLCGCGTTYADWELSPDSTVLTETVRINDEYELVETLYGHDLAGEMIEFMSSVYSETYEQRFYIYATSETPDVIYLEGYSGYGGPILVYSRVGYPTALKSYISGNIETSRVVKGDDMSFELSSDDLARLDSLTKTHTASVQDLRLSLIAELRVYGAEGTLSHLHGGFYNLVDDVGVESVFYVNYDALDNSYFDANGNFSYRQGEVELVKLSLDDANRVLYSEEYESHIENSITSEVGDTTEADRESEEIAMRILLVLFLLFCVIFPATIPFIFMLVDLCRRGFRGTHFTTYIVLISYVVMIIASVALVLIL